MKPTELAEQVDIEFEAIRLTTDEIASLRQDVSGREPTVRELAAAGCSWPASTMASRTF